jgi:hypothetical protein
VRNDYIQYVLGSYVRSSAFDSQVGEGWVLDDTYQDIARAAIVAAFGRYEVSINPEIYDDHFYDIFAELVEGKGVVYDGDEYSDQWFKFVPVNKNKIVDRILQANPALQRLERLGASAPAALKRALDKIVAEDNRPPLTASSLPSLHKSEAPASDRIVLLSDNQPAIEAVRASLSELSAQLQKANDVGEMTLSEVEQARNEIWHLEQAFNAERVRVDWIEPFAKNSLNWIAEKAAGAAVGKAALAVIAAIAALFGISF